MQKFHSLTIKEISKETPKAYSLLFEIPLALRESFAFISGQYITVKCTVNGKEIRRCYSISSIPAHDMALQIIVKSVPGGVFSSHVAENLKAGDRLEISEPEGEFCYQPDGGHSRTLAAVAAGSGITPVFSMIRSVLTASNDRIILFYGNRSVEETIFHKEISQLAGEFSERFTVIYFYTRENISGWHSGRIDQKVIADTLQEDAWHFSKIDTFYLCGPDDLIKSTTETLLALPVPAENILHELFFLPATEEQNAPAPEIQGHTMVTLILDGEEEVITVDRNVLLLDSLLDAGFDIPYSCQNAICSTCLCMLTKGEVYMAKNEVLSGADIEEGKIVVCQSYPVSDEIVLNYDMM